MGVENSVALSAKQAAEHCTVFHSVNSIKLRMPILNHHGSGFLGDYSNLIVEYRYIRSTVVTICTQNNEW